MAKRTTSKATIEIAEDTILKGICAKARTNSERGSSLTMQAVFRVLHLAGEGTFGGNRADLSIVRSDAVKSKSLIRIIVAKTLGTRPVRPGDGADATAYNAFQADERLVREAVVISGILVSLGELVTFDDKANVASIKAEHVIENRLHNYVSAHNRAKVLQFGGKPMSFKFMDGSGDKPKGVTVKNSLAFLKATFPPATGGTGERSSRSFDDKLAQWIGQANKTDLFAVRAKIDAALGLEAKPTKSKKSKAKAAA